MADLWHPQAEQVRAPESSWGRYVDGYQPRGVLHTTETDSYTPSTKDYYGRDVWPHATIGIKDGRGHIWQHIPINRAARALKNAAGGVETNNTHAIQCEIVWRAQNAPTMPDELLTAIATWMRWVEASVGVQPVAARFYGPGEGIVVASSTSPARMSPDQWHAFNGWCGHQHVPENDHWDPGAIPINRLLEENDDMALDANDKAWLTDLVYNIGKGFADAVIKACDGDQTVVAQVDVQAIAKAVADEEAKRLQS